MGLKLRRSETEDSLKNASGVRSLMMYFAVFLVGMSVASVSSKGGGSGSVVGTTASIYKSPAAATTTILDTNVENVESCTERLNTLDAISDEKRKVRQDFTLNSGYTPKNVNANMDLWEPEAVCFSEERFGQTKGYSTTHIRRYQAFGDGPKFICGVDLMAAEAKAAREDSRHQNCLVYNIGSHNQIDYEVSVNQYIGCEVHTFDPTVETSKYKGNDYSIFHQWGVGLDGEEINFNINGKDWHWFNKGFDKIVEELGHKGRKIDMLKIDCEGCEWVTMPPILDQIAQGHLEIDQIQIELHPQQKIPFEQLVEFFTHVDNAGMRIMHKERNHWGCKGWRCLEYALVSEAFLRKANAAALGCPLDS